MRIYKIILIFIKYLNGIKNGKEYDSEGRLIFIGDYLDWKQWNGNKKTIIMGN